MIGALAILAVAAWFYRTAERADLPALEWCVAGVLLYYGGFAFWMYLVLSPVLGDQFRNHGLWLGLGMDLSSVVVGVLSAAAFRRFVMLKKGRTPFERPF